MLRFALIAVVIVAGFGMPPHADLAESSTTQCCNPGDKPTDCTTGATCCGVTNKWQCNDSEGVPTCEEAGPVCYCGGFGGKLCPDTAYCDYLGDTCYTPDLGGRCVPFPAECPPSWCSPVCSCTGNNYTHVCDAELIAQDPYRRHGFCDEIFNVIFFRLSPLGPAMNWEEAPAALYYNIYKKVRTPSDGPLTDSGTCFFTDVTSESKGFLENPEPGNVWLLQVTATYPSGEQTMGMRSDCLFRQPAESCQ